MADAMLNLRALVEHSADADLLREMNGLAVARLMEMEEGATTGAAWKKKSPCASADDAQQGVIGDRHHQSLGGTGGGPATQR